MDLKTCSYGLVGNYLSGSFSNASAREDNRTLA